MKKALWIYTIVWLIFLFFLSRSVPAYYGDLATDQQSFTIGIAGQNANQITSLTTVFPLKKANGWAGTYVSRQVASKENGFPICPKRSHIKSHFGDRNMLEAENFSGGVLIDRSEDRE